MRRLAAVFLLAAAPSAASAEDTPPAPSWALVRDDGALIAHVALPQGPVLAFKCRSRQLSAVLQGLDGAAGELPVAAIIDGVVDRTDIWDPVGEGLHHARRPAWLARAIARGSNVNLSLATSPGEPARSGTFLLPADAQPVLEVLEACREPAQLPRDDVDIVRLDGPAPTVTWVERPRPWTSLPLERGYSKGATYLTCTTLEAGRLTDCEIESETPAGAGFATVAVRASERARVNADAPAGVRIGFQLTYHMWY